MGMCMRRTLAEMRDEEMASVEWGCFDRPRRRMGQTKQQARLLLGGGRGGGATPLPRFFFLPFTQMHAAGAILTLFWAVLLPLLLPHPKLVLFPPPVQLR